MRKFRVPLLASSVALLVVSLLSAAPAIGALPAGTGLPVASADVRVIQTDEPDPAAVGTNVTYLVTTFNDGPEAASSVTLEDNLPAGITFVSATPSQGSCGESGGTVTCDLGGINPEANSTVTIVVTTTAEGTLTNTASVSVSEAETDPNTSNNTATEQTTVSAPPGSADLGITKTDAPDPADVGENITYIARVVNHGPDLATDVSLVDTLPAEVTFVSARPSQGTCTNEPPGIVTCAFGQIDPGAVAKATIVVATTVEGVFTNTASVSASQSDPNASNNTVTATTKVVAGTGPAPVYVTVADYYFTPAGPTVQQGGTVVWSFKGPSQHSATDASGMALFNSGRKAAGGSYSFRFVAAGTFRYKCVVHPTKMKGVVKVPVIVSPRTGQTDGTYDVQWGAGTPPAGFVSDVQVKRPNSLSFVDWQIGQTATAATFTPDAGAGTYVFRARLRKPSVAKSSMWSPVGTLIVRDVGAASRPSIVLVVTDDQRADTLWAMKAVRNRLAAHGVTFNNAYAVNPLCCPSRASILTGKYSHSTKVYLNEGPNGGFNKFNDSSTIATWLRGAGYRTALVGKYLNQYCDSVGSYIPPGWDRWVAFTANCGQGDYYNYKLSVDGVLRFYGSAPSDYSADVLATHADSFIRSTPASEPLFLYFTPNAPHKGGPANPTAVPAPRHANAFSDLPPARPPNYNEADMSDKPSWLRNKAAISASFQNTLDNLRKNQLRSLLAVDEAVADILDALEDTGRLSNTLFVFTSDHGYLLGEHRLSEKGAAYEESSRVPMVVRYDPLINAARDESSIVANIDLAPTLAEVAGVGAPRAEGKSLLPLLSSPSAPWRPDILFDHLGGSVPSFCGIRSPGFTYVVYKAGEEELYDLRADPYQLDNRARDPAYADTLAAMRTRVRELCNPPPPGFTLVH